MTYDVVPPDPAGTIESLGALGYTLEAAVADLVDNSIDAAATRIDVQFHWAAGDSYITITDNGHGIAEAELNTAMAIAARGPRAARGKSELGRFGMGLKTASFSQAACLTLWTRTDKQPAQVRMWDLQRVIASGEWQLSHETSAAGAAVLAQATAGLKGSGTVVLWQQLTKLVDELAELDDQAGHKQFLEAISRVDAHLAMTFARFLPGGGRRPGRKGIGVFINGAEVRAWDPFLQSHEDTRPGPPDRLETEGQPITVQPYVLPPKRQLTDEEYQRAGGPRGWLEQQGFYVYRNDRLIVAGGWLGLHGFRSDEKHVLARIAVEIPSTLDQAWSVDVKKATAHPPMALRGDLTRTAKATRASAQRILTSISKAVAHEKADDLSFVWRPEHKDGELRLRINWEHPLVKQALQVSSEAKPTVRALLRFMEETVPLPALRMLFDHEEDRDYEPFSQSAPTEVISIAERMYGAYISNGLSPQQAKVRLQHTSPFNEYPDLLTALHLD